MRFKKEVFTVLTMLSVTVFTFGFGGMEGGGHGGQVKEIKANHMSMHQMKKLPSYTPPEALNEKLHHETMVYSLNKMLKDDDNVSKMLAQYKIIMLRLEEEQLQPNNVERLKKWVEAGGTLWLDDGWTAAKHFGVEQKIGPNSLIFSRENGCIKQHPLTTAVSDLAMLNGFYMVPNDSFTEIIRMDDMIYLATKDLGKGKILFYISGLTEKLDYYRLMVNLREWSAGYEVPPMVDKEIEEHTWETTTNTD